MRTLLALALLGSGGPVALAQDEAVEEPTDEERAEAFAEVDEQLKVGQKARAADALLALTQDEEKAVFHGEAYEMLADLLVELELPYAALVAYNEALLLDANPVLVGKALAMADAVGDTALLEPVFATNVGVGAEGAALGHMAYLAARENYRQGNLGVALGITAMVGKDHELYARSQHLKGMVLSQQGKFQDAIAPLATAMALASAGDDKLFADLAIMNLARAYYGAENYPRAIEYYAKVPRDSWWWPEAQFERAWAHFMLTDMSGTLGLLHNHMSPFLRDWYFPEARLLRIYALFNLCKFPTASVEIDAFAEDYAPLRDELDSLLSKLDAKGVWADARAYHAGNDHELPATVLRDLPQEHSFLATLNAVESAEEELGRLKGVSANPFAQAATEWVSARKDAMIEAEGGRIRGRIVVQASTLRDMLDNAEISKLDMLKLETRLYEQASNTGTMVGARDVAIREQRSRNANVWAFQGESWGDELGYYKVLAEPECPASLMPK